MEGHARLLLQWNRKISLTSLTDPGEIVRRHFVEPLVALPWLPPEGVLLDLGTGAGFPGLPLHLARGRGEVILVESSLKKTQFLESVVRHCSMEGVRVVRRHARRASELFDLRPIDAMTMRAIPSPESRVSWLEPLLAPGGVALFFLGEKGAVEVLKAVQERGLEIVAKQLIPKSRASYLVVVRTPRG